MKMDETALVETIQQLSPRLSGGKRETSRQTAQDRLTLIYQNHTVMR